MIPIPSFCSINNNLSSVSSRQQYEPMQASKIDEMKTEQINMQKQLINRQQDCEL